MGVRDKVALTIVIIALIQIACRHCMPRTPRKASLSRYLNDLKPVKNNPVPTPYSPSRVNKTPKQTFGKTAQNGRISQNSLPKKSLYKTYNFPENEYPLDNSPRDPFRIGMNFNENNHVNTLLKARNLQSSAISDLKKEMKMKRKLLSNKQVNNENRQLKTDMSLIKFAPSADSTRFLDSETFPEVQYPLNTMDTWGPNYWNYLPFTQEKPYPRIGQQTFNHKAKEDINQPFTRLTKAKASKYLQSYNKLKEEHRRTSTENSKRSNVGQTGLNFTKTATSERVSDDFITAGLVSNIPSNSTEMRKALTSSTKITASSENTCPVTEYPYHPVPIPYKVIKNNNENISPALGLKYDTEELADVDNSDIAQTLQFIQEILFNDDTCSAVSPGNFSKELEKHISTSDCSDIPENKDIPTTLVDCGKNITITPSKETSQEVSDDMTPVGILQNNLPSVPEEIIPENIPTVAGPLNVRMPLPSSEPLHEIEALKNTPKSGLTKMASLSNGFAVPSSTSIIIIPTNNNAVGKSKSHMFETISDTPIIVYLPSSHTPSFNHIVPSSLDYTVPNNQLYNVLSNMAPLQNDNPFSPALVSELLNSNSDSGSSLPIDETLPTNSMCYNNESSPSSIREKPISDIILHKLLTDDAPFVTTTRDEKMSEPPIETGDLDVNSNTQPITDFEHPLFDFSGSEFTSLSHGPYNKVPNNELPIVAREINSDQQILNDSSNDLFIPTQNVTSEHLHNTTSMDSVSEVSLSEIPNDVPPVALDKNFSSVTSTDSMEILNTNTLLPESIPNLQEPVDTLTESLPQPIDKILLSTTLIEPPSAKLPQPKESPVSPTLLSETFSDKLPEIIDAVLSTTPVSATTMDSTSQHIGNTPSTEINSSPMMTDMTLKTELYKIRQILDKMLSIETPTYSQPPPIDTTLEPMYESDRLLLPMNEMPTEILPVPAVDKKVPLPATDSPNDSLRQVHETLPRISVHGTPTDTLPLPGNKLVIPNKLLIDTPSLPIDKTVPTTLESETSADDKQYLLDKLLTPLSEIATSRTEDTPENGLSHKMDDLPLKMDLKFPNIYEVCSGDLLLSVDNLPTKIHPENTTNPGVSTNELPTQVVEVPVSNLPTPTDVLSLPANEVLEDASPDVAAGVKALMSGFSDKLLQDFPSSKIPPDGLSTLPVNVFKLPIHETFPDGQLNEILSTGPPQNDHLPSSLQKLIPDLSLSNAFTNEPSLENDSPSLVIDKNIKIPHSTVDTKDLPLDLEYLLSPENNVTPDSVVTYIPSAVSPFLNKGRQTTNLDQTSDEVLSVSDIPRDKLTLSVHKMSPVTDDTQTDLPLPINKTPTTSKLPITKALLKNVLSDINKAGLSSIAQTLPDTPHALLDKTLHYLDVKSPVFETKNIPLRPEEKIFPNSEYTDNLIDYVPFSEKPVDTSIADLPSELLLPTDEMHKNKPYILTDNVEDHDKNETQSLDPINDLPVPIETGYPPKDTTKTSSSSKLPITEKLLENVLSDITKKGFSVPVVQSLPVTTPSVLDKTPYHVESPISYITEYSPALQVDKTLPITSLSDHSTDILPISIEDTLPLPIDKMFSQLPNLSSPSGDIVNISRYDKEQNESENPPSKNPTGDRSSASPMKGILSPSKDTLRDVKDPNNKIQSSSKLPITKTLLENVLSDITTKGFSVPVAQSLPVTSPAVLDKAPYYVESPISHITEYSPALPVDKTLPITPLSDHSTDNLPISIEDTVPLSIDETFSELESLGNPTELSSPVDNMRPEIPNISMYDKEQDESDNPSSKNPTDDLSSASPMEGILSLSKDKPSDLKTSNNKAPSSSKLPIIKALLENMLSDINTRGFSLQVPQALPVAPRSQLDKSLYFLESPVSDLTEKISVIPIDNFPFSGINEDVAPQPTYPTLPDFPILGIPTDSKDETANPSSENLTNDLSSASPMEGIFSLSKDTPSGLTLPNNKASSKLPITKALLENVLSDITTKDFSVPVAQSLPVTSPSVLDKTPYYVESPISHITEYSPALQVDKTLPITSLSDHSTDILPISIEDTLPLPIDKTFSQLHCLDIPTEFSSPSGDIVNISRYDKEQNESENPPSKNPTGDRSSASPMKGILSPSKDTLRDVKDPNNKIQSSSKLPITKTLLENVLSDITTKGFSVPVAQSLPVTSPAVLDKAPYYVESPISHITEYSPALQVDKTLPITSLSDHSTDILPISIEDTLPLPIDKTFSQLHCLDIPTEFSSPSGDIVNISRYDKEQNESENPPSKNPTGDRSSASPMKGILSPSKDTLRDVKDPNNKIQSSSKLPITKTLLENVLSDITTKGFSVPVAQSLPVTSPAVLDKAPYYVESPISHITEYSPALPVDKTLPITSLSDHSTDNLPISIEDTVPLPIDEKFSELESLDNPTELSSPVDNMRPDIPNISMYDKEQDESDNPSSKKPTDDLSSASPMEGILSLSKDKPSDLKTSNNKAPSSSKLPITKALLENMLSDINTRGFSLQVPQALPVAPPSQLDKSLYFLESPVSDLTEKISVIPIDNFPSSGINEDVAPQPTYPTLPDFPILGIPTDSKDETANPSSENLTNDLSSASPMEGIFSLSKDTPSGLTLPNNKASSKLPITKALLENVLSDITTKDFSVPVAQSLPVTSPAVLDKAPYYVESPISHITEYSPALPVDKTLPITSISDHSTDNLSISIEDTVPLPIDEKFLENMLSDINTRGFSLQVPQALPVAPRSQLDKSLYFLESPVSDLTEKISVIPIDNFPSSGINEDVAPQPTYPTLPDFPILGIPTDSKDETANPSSENLTNDLSSASPMEGIFSLSKDTPSGLTLPNNKASSKLPITKALLENVLSDITTKGFSVPVAPSLPVTSPAVLDKAPYYVESPISHIAEYSPALPVDKTLPITSLSDHLTDILPISIEDTLPLPIDKMFSQLHCLDIPTELSSPSGDIENISRYDKEQNESENPPSKNPTGDRSSASPMKGILSPSKDTLRDVKDPNNKIQSSSKLPITKTLLENVLSDITTKGFSVPVAQSLPVTSPAVLDKAPYYVESPISHITEYSPALPVDKTLPITSLSDHSTDNLPISIEDTVPLPIDEKFSELESLDNPTELSSPVDNMRPDIPNISMYDKEQGESDNPSSKNPTDDLSSASPMEGILSLSKDKPSDLKTSNNKAPSSSKLPITKVLLKNMLSDINTRGFSLQVPQALPVAPRSQLGKSLYFLESPVSHLTEKISVIPIDNFPSSGINEDVSPQPTYPTLPDFPILGIPTDSKDKTANPSSENLTNDLSSASPLEGIFSLSKNTPSFLTLPNNKASSKLPITKALLENVLSDITTKGFSVPVTKSLPVISSSVLDKAPYYVESPISHITEYSPALPVDKTLPITSLSDTTDILPISIEDTLPLPIDKTFSELQCLDIPTELSSPSGDIANISRYDKEQNESENPSSKNPTGDRSSASPMKGILSPSKDTLRDVTDPNNRIQSSSKLPITKILLENVLSDITTKGFSVPVAQSLPVTSPAVLDKAPYYVESPISHITEYSPALPVDKTLPITSISDHSTDNLAIFIEDTVPLPIDEKFLENMLSDINTRGFSLQVPRALPVAPRSQLDKSLYFLESPVSDLTEKISVIPIDNFPSSGINEDVAPQPTYPTLPDFPILGIPTDSKDETANPSSENLTNDLSSASPMEGIFSLSKDTPSGLTLPNNKASSKLPITKALLENVLSDITTKGFSVPVAPSLPVTSPAVLDKAPYYVESPISHITEYSPALPVDKTLPITSLSDHLTDILPISIEDTLPLPIDKMFSQLHCLDIPTELSSPSGDIANISRYDKEQNESEKPPSKNPTGDRSSASPMKGILSLSKDKPSDLKTSNNKAPSSSKLPITKVLLENMLSDINTRGFSLQVPQALPVAPRSQLGKSLYFLESPVSHLTEKISVIPIDNFPSSGINEDVSPQPTYPTLPDFPILGIPTDSKDKTANPSSENLTNDLSSASPLEGIFSLSKNTPSFLTLPNNKASSKLPITKALLENVLSDITTKGFSVPVTKSLPVISSSVLDKAPYYVESPISHITEYSPALPVDKTLPITSLSDTTDILPISIEDTLPLPIDKTFSELQCLDIPTELSSPSGDIANISRYDKEQNESENPSSKNPTGDRSSASPMKGILSPSKDTLRDVTDPNNRIQSSSKLPITKILLENVLSDITTKGFSVPVAQSLPVTSPAVLDKAPYYVESPISHITEYSPALPVDKTLPITSISDHSTDNLPIFIEDTVPLPIDEKFLENMLSDINTRGFSLQVPRALPVAPRSQLDKSLYFLESPVSDLTEKISVIPIDNFPSSGINEDVAPQPTYPTLPDFPILGIPTDSKDETANPSSENLTNDLSSASPMEGIFSLSKDTPSGLTLPNNKASSKLPITKALLENVLSDITTKGFSVPVAPSLPVTSPAVLDKAPYYVESPISHITEYSPALPVDKTLPITSLSDHLTDILPISIEDTLPLPIDKMFSQLHCLDIPTELSSPSGDIANISRYDKEQNESEKPPSKNPTGDRSSASPMKGILSLSKDKPSDLKTSNNKAPSSSKLPITKVLLENMLSDINTRGFSLQVPQALPVAPRSQLGKSLYFLESPVSHLTEKISVIPIDNFPSSGINEDVSPQPTYPTLPDFPILGIPTDSKNKTANPSSENLTNDLSSASPLEGIFSLSKNTPSFLTLPNNKASSKLPITKALLENVLSDITTKGFSVPVTKSLPVISSSVLDKAPYYVESPISHITEYSPALPVDKTLPITSLSDTTDILPISIEDTLPLPIDKTFSELQCLDIPTELSSPSGDIANISRYDKEQNESENPSSKNPTGDLSSTSPMKGILPLSKDTLRDVKYPNNKIPSSSKLPITKALFSSENVYVYYVESPISQITEDRPSLPVGKILPDTSFSNHQTDNLPISIEDNLPLPIHKTFAESQSYNLGLDVPNILMYDKEQDESANQTSENLTDYLTSASPMEGILSLSKDTPNDLTLPNNKAPSSSEEPIAKALLENVLSDINTGGFSFPVAQALPVAPRLQLAEKSSFIPTDNFPSSGINEDVAPRPTDTTLPDNPILGIPTDKSLMDKIHNSDILTDDVGHEDNSEMLTDDIGHEDNYEMLTDDVEDEDEYKFDFLTDVEDKDQSDFWTDETIQLTM